MLSFFRNLALKGFLRSIMWSSPSFLLGTYQNQRATLYMSLKQLRNTHTKINGCFFSSPFPTFYHLGKRSTETFLTCPFLQKITKSSDMMPVNLGRVNKLHCLNPSSTNTKGPRNLLIESTAFLLHTKKRNSTKRCGGRRKIAHSLRHGALSLWSPPKA